MVQRLFNIASHGDAEACGHLSTWELLKKITSTLATTRLLTPLNSQRYQDSYTALRSTPYPVKLPDPEIPPRPAELPHPDTSPCVAEPLGAGLAHHEQAGAALSAQDGGAVARRREAAMKEGDAPNRRPACGELGCGRSLRPLLTLERNRSGSPGPAPHPPTAAVPVSAMAGGLEPTAPGTGVLLAVAADGPGPPAGAEEPAGRLPLDTSGAGCPPPHEPMQGCPRGGAESRGARSESRRAASEHTGGGSSRGPALRAAGPRGGTQSLRQPRAEAAQGRQPTARTLLESLWMTWDPRKRI